MLKVGIPLMIHNLFISMRPKQWSKNALVFAGLLFAKDFMIVPKIVESLLAFILFCLASSSAYLINDVLDRKGDAQHPQKKHRPVASAKLSVSVALAFAFFFASVSLVAGFQLDLRFALILAGYVALTLAYSIILKKIIILDVLIIASGFVFRAVAGAFAIQEEVSSWLIICTIFLALFFALGKRRAEIVSLGENAGGARKTLEHYDVRFLDHLIVISTAACLMAYALYTLDPGTVAKFGTRSLVITLPFVIYGLFRYLFLTYNGSLGETPENAILGDRPILICVFLYLVTVVAILY